MAAKGGGSRKRKQQQKKFYIVLAVIIVVLAVIAAGVIAYLYVNNKLPEDFEEQLYAWFGGGDDEGNLGGGEKPVPAPQGVAAGDLLIKFIDVGQGDSIYIKFPDGKDMLVDCGNSSQSSDYRDNALSVLETYVTDDIIEYLMLTHCDSDHVYFLDEVIETYDVDNIYMPNVMAAPTSVTAQAKVNALPTSKTSVFTDKDKVTSACYAEFFADALTEADAVITRNIGTFSITGVGYSLDFYCYDAQEWTATDLSSAEEKNAISPIGVLTCNGTRVVLTGDSNEINEPKWINYMKSTYNVNSLDCDVLKVGHHGSESSSTADFLSFIKCEYAVISCNEEGNTFIHPRQATLDRLKAQNMTVYRTDLNGTVSLTLKQSGGYEFSSERQAEQSAELIGADMDND